jgi:hypothetical protein
MASVIHEPPYNRRTTDRTAVYAVGTEGIRVSWGSIVGGVLLAVGLLILLTALGAAIGISATEPGQTDAGTAGRAAGIYGAVSLLLALFFGGWASTRIGAIVDRATSFCEGALVWVVSIMLVAGLATMGLSNLVGGAMSLAGTASQAAGAVAQSPQAQQQAQQQGNASAGSSGQVVDQAKQKLGEIQERLQSGELSQKAAEAKPAAARGAWITFGALVLSLLTAVIGAMAGRRDPVERVRT